MGYDLAFEKRRKLNGKWAKCFGRSCRHLGYRDLVVYGYDRSATLDDDATLNDTTRNDATHDDLAPPDDDDTPDVKRKRRLEGLALTVCFIPKSQTCNSYKLNSFR